MLEVNSSVVLIVGVEQTDKTLYVTETTARLLGGEVAMNENRRVICGTDTSVGWVTGLGHS